jgi:hypothetical protein
LAEVEIEVRLFLSQIDKSKQLLVQIRFQVTFQVNLRAPLLDDSELALISDVSIVGGTLAAGLHACWALKQTQRLFDLPNLQFGYADA